MVLAPVQLADRRFGAGRAALQVAGQDPVPEEAHDLHTGVAVGEPLPHERVAVEPALADQVTEPVEFVAEQYRIGGRLLAALVAQQRHRDLPPGVDLSDDVHRGRARGGEEDLVELAVAVHRRDGPHLDPGLVQRNQQEGDATVERDVRVRPRQHEDPVRLVGHRRPDLLTVDHPLVAVKNRTGTQGSQVGAGAGLGVSLTPFLLP